MSKVQFGNLYLVPGVGVLSELSTGTFDGAVWLDNVLYWGGAGLYFRRLRVRAEVFPETRSMFEQMRFKYLRKYLMAVKSLCPAGFVLHVVGSQASDVDLVDFGSVAVVHLADEALSELSCRVYGDSVTLWFQTRAVERQLCDSADGVLYVDSWDQLVKHVTGQWGYGGLDPQALVSGEGSRRAFEALFPDVESVLLESALVMDGVDFSSPGLAAFAYVAGVRLEWREAVLRIVGSSSTLTGLFSLPYYMVDVKAVAGLRVGVGHEGFLEAGSEGETMIDFVRSVAGAAAVPRELAGSWLVSVFTDPVSPARVYGRSSGDVKAHTVSVYTGSKVVEHPVAEGVVRPLGVPMQLDWLYAFVRGVMPMAGVRAVRPGDAVVGDASEIRGLCFFDALGVKRGWDPTLRLAAMLSAHARRERAVQDECKSLMHFVSRVSLPPAALDDLLDRLAGVDDADLVLPPGFPRLLGTGPVGEGSPGWWLLRPPDMLWCYSCVCDEQRSVWRTGSKGLKNVCFLLPFKRQCWPEVLSSNPEGMTIGQVLLAPIRMRRRGWDKLGVSAEETELGLGSSHLARVTPLSSCEVAQLPTLQNLLDMRGRGSVHTWTNYPIREAIAAG